MHCKWLYHTDRLESGCVQREIEWIFLGEMERGSDIRDVEKWYGLNPQNQSNDRYSRMVNHAYSGRKPGKQRGAFLTVNSPTWLKEGERVSEMNQWVDSRSRWLFEAHIPNSCKCQKEWLRKIMSVCAEVLEHSPFLHIHWTLSFESVFSDLFQLRSHYCLEKTCLKIEIAINKMIRNYSLFQRKSSLCFPFKALYFWQDFQKSSLLKKI